MNGYKVIVTKSTVPIGTGEHMRKLISEQKKTGLNFGVVSNPEFLREGAAINDFMRPDRVVIGSRDEEAIAIMKRSVSSALSDRSAVCDHFAGSRGTHQVRRECFPGDQDFLHQRNREPVREDRLRRARRGARRSAWIKRIGSKFLHPGPGFGGSCFPKDTQALASVARQFDCDSLIVDAVIEVNQRQRQAMVPKIEKLVGELKGKTIAVLGLAFKPETDDMREAPAIEIIQRLDRAVARRCAPTIRWRWSEAAKLLPEIDYADDEYAAVPKRRRAGFRHRVEPVSRARHDAHSRSDEIPSIADLRNIYEPEDMRELGFEYVGVGR